LTPVESFERVRALTTTYHDIRLVWQNKGQHYIHESTLGHSEKTRR
jgi:hypothetical protein